MEKIFEHSEFIREIAEKLIDALPDLWRIKELEPSIAYMESNARKRSSTGLVYADCERVKPKMREFMNYDYIITAYMPNCSDLTENQWKLLIYHELLHIDVEEGEEGKLVCKIKGHNLNDFRQITDKYGVDWAELEEVPDILEEVEE